MSERTSFESGGDCDIAIVGMAAHVPGASSIEQYWANLRDGVESIRRLSEDELLEAGEAPGRIRDKNYVPAAAPLDSFEWFDGEFFGFSPKDSAILDPQHRQFLEVVWEAFENAGHPPEKFDGRIGVWAGCGMGSYFYFNICSNPDLVANTGMFLLRHTGNDKDFMSTRVSHIFDLKGPSLSIQTACSTSLVAVHTAAQALLSGECDMALAGGVTIELPQNRGYMFREGEVLSPDGHCHAFDHRAEGTVFGSGAGVVVLRRLEDAIKDGDHIWGVVKGTAINNDGADKAGYLAPSVSGQAEAIAEAHAVAGVSADTVTYVECHGTGTYLGDPIEVAAMTSAFRETTQDVGYCRIGSVKTNIGHLDTAAGVASLIKATMALYHRQMPPSLGYEAPNPAIDFETSPFKVNDTLTEWTDERGPRRAGVNSLGVGGTNAHAIVEEAPAAPAHEPSDWPFHLLVVSGRTKTALDANCAALASHLRLREDQPLEDVAWTLKQGRRAFDHRRVLVAESHAEAAALLTEGDPRKVYNHSALEDPDLVFMFPGGGSQFAGMARGLYETEPVFQDWVDQGLEILQKKLDYDIRALWLPELDAVDAANETLKRPSVQLPLILIVEYALAQLWMSWGVKPAALVGHSMGENAAACVAGVMSFEDCIGLVHLRGTLFDTVEPGGMLSVSLPVEELDPYLGDTLDIASVNAPGLSVISGPDAALDALQKRLAADEVDCRRILIDIAAHSRMLEPILERFGAYLRSIQLNAPQIPIISNRSGAALTAAEATSPDYWVGHLRNTVHFADCMATLTDQPNRVYMEVGPGKALSSLAQACGVPAQQVISSLRHPEEKIADDKYFLGVLGRLWAVGVEIDWEPIWGEAKRRRVPLPTYAFQRSPYFIEAGVAQAAAETAALHRSDDMAEWGWRPIWRPRLADCVVDVENGLAETAPETWLIFVDEVGVGARVVSRLREAGHRVIEIHAGDAFAKKSDDYFIVPPERGRDGYDMLFRDLMGGGTTPNRIAHFWLTTRKETFRPGSSFFHRNKEQGFFSLMFLAQAIGEENLPTPIHISVFTTGAAQFGSEALPYPEKAAILGPARVIPREFPGVTVATVDLELAPAGERRFGAGRSGPSDLDRAATKALEDLFAPSAESVAIHRGDRRYEIDFQQAPLTEIGDDSPALRENGVWLITGGFGGIGLTVAAELHRRSKARLVLVARSELPPRAEWERHIRTSAPNDPISRRIKDVRKLEALGAEVLVVAADVCNVADMRAAVAAATERFGAVNGVIHAAGVINDGPLLAKSPAIAEDVLAPKVHGVRVLDELFPDGALDAMVLFASTSTVIGPAGQVDYIAANEYLNAYAKSRKGGQTKVVAINWGVWNEVGMAAEAVAERTGEHEEAPMEPVDAPLLDEAGFDQNGHRIFTARYAPAERWFLDQHRTGSGDAVVPGTGYLELATEALRANREEGVFEIRELMFLRPIQIDDDETRDIRVRLTRTDEGYGYQVQSGCKVDGKEAYQLHAEGRLAMRPFREPAKIDVAAIAARCPTVETAQPGQKLRAAQETHLQFGPRWRCLMETRYGEKEGLARLSLSEAYRGDMDQGYLLHPALMDIATGWAMGLIEGYGGKSLWVPIAYRSVRVHRPLPAEIVSWVRIDESTGAGGPFATFDVVIADASGEVCVEVEGFSIKKLSDKEGLAKAPKPKAAEVEFADGSSGAPQPLSPAEERLAHNLSQGILPAEGGDAFIRALALGAPQVVVTSLDLLELAKQTKAVDSVEQGGGQQFDRPELDSAYIEPRNDIERTLVGFWEELLGVNQVGVDDDFFELGGHSLIAVRLFAMVKKAYRIEFPISVLFEAPTIAKCAALIGERVGVTDDGGAGGEAGVAKPSGEPTRRFTHLVPMHDGEGGPKAPFFLVAGMFGNVLNLRHLAHLIGTDRPFYGLQARGLLGGEAPHESLVEAATDYIAEIRTVQPEGPYMIGGFSGGGITAYEIAHQLKAAGREGERPGDARHAASDQRAALGQRPRADQAGGLPREGRRLCLGMGEEPDRVGTEEAPQTARRRGSDAGERLPQR